MSHFNLGNKHAAKGKEWFDAVRKQCVQKKALDKIAAKLVELALNGEPWAIQEIGNRYDGKPVQQSELTGKGGRDLFELPEWIKLGRESEQ